MDAGRLKLTRSLGDQQDNPVNAEMTLSDARTVDSATSRIEESCSPESAIRSSHSTTKTGLLKRSVLPVRNPT